MCMFLFRFVCAQFQGKKRGGTKCMENANMSALGYAQNIRQQ